MRQSKVVTEVLVLFLFKHTFLVFLNILVDSNFKQAHQEHSLSKLEFFI